MKTKMDIPDKEGRKRLVIVGGGDDTLFALADGILRFERKGRDKKQASVYPVESK